jgi:hypothetical protein
MLIMMLLLLLLLLMMMMMMMMIVLRTRHLALLAVHSLNQLLIYCWSQVYVTATRTHMYDIIKHFVDGDESKLLPCLNLSFDVK